MVIGTVAIIISGISIGAWTAGEQASANFAMETKEQRNLRSKVGLYTGLVGLVAFCLASVIWFLK